MNDFKIMFVGCSGSGKTTAIACVSDIRTVSTDVNNSDRENYNKEVTTVGLDYGEVTLPGQTNLLRLYGTPGQSRFSFMWNIIGKGTLGIIFLADNSRSDPLGEMKGYLHAFRHLFKEGKAVAVLGIVKTDIAPYPDKESYQQLLRDMGLSISVVNVDERESASVLLMLRVMSRHLEKFANTQGEVSKS